MKFKLWLAIAWRAVALAVCMYLMANIAGCATGQARGTKLVKRACAETEIVSYTPEAWQRRDQLAYQPATSRCVQFYPRSPCLKKFIRYQVGRYAAVCSGVEDVAFAWSDG